jgi:hypothetical protein
LGNQKQADLSAKNALCLDLQLPASGQEMKATMPKKVNTLKLFNNFKWHAFCNAQSGLEAFLAMS